MKMTLQILRKRKDRCFVNIHLLWIFYQGQIFSILNDVGRADHFASSFHSVKCCGCNISCMEVLLPVKFFFSSSERYLKQRGSFEICLSIVE